VIEKFYDFVDFVGCVEQPYRETQRYDAGNTENVALMKQDQYLSISYSFQFLSVTGGSA
jgi:hypothetical protein